MCSNRRETGSDTLELRKKPIVISFKCPKNFFMIRIQYFSKIIFSPKFLYGLTINRIYH